MVENDDEVGQRARYIGQLADLAVIEHGVIGQPAPGERAQSVAVAGVAEQTGRCRPDHDSIGKGRVMRHAVTDSAEGG